MIRLIFTTFLAFALTACGSDEFSVDIAQPAHKTMADLGAFRSGSMVQMLGARPLTKSKPDDQSVLYTMGKEGDQATVLIRVESIDTNKSRAHITIDTPNKTINIGGKPMVIDQRKVRNGLKKSMGKYAKAVNSGASKTSILSSMSSVLDAVTVMVDESSMDLAQRLESNPELAYELAGSMGDWGSDSSSDQQTTYAASAPTADTRPMDDTEGWKPEAMDDASGASTDPDAYENSGW